MANTKISNLPAATTPVAGTEVLPIVQSSTTAKVSIANLTVGRAVSASSYDATGATAPANGIFSLAAGTLAFSVASSQIGKFISGGGGGAFEVDDAASAGYNVRRYISVTNLNTGTGASASVFSSAFSTTANMTAFSPSHSATALANKAVFFGSDRSSNASSGTVIADFSTGTNQIQFYTGTTASPTLTGYITTLGDWEIGINNSSTALRYVQVTNVNTGSLAGSSLTTRSDSQTLNLAAYSSTHSTSFGVTLAGKAVLLASGSVAGTGLTIWDNSANPQIDFVVGSSGIYAGRINNLGGWDLNTKPISAGSFSPSSSTLIANGMYLPSANTISITNNSAVTASFTNTNNFDVGTGNSTNAQRYAQVVNTSTLSSAFATVAARSDSGFANLQAYSSTYSSASPISSAGKAALYTTMTNGLLIWDNSTTPKIDFIVGASSVAASISSGAVFTLTNNPVLSGGTANGVAYLNGSKVLTTGTALVFDAANTRLGVGGTPSYPLDVTGSGNIIRAINSATSASFILSTNSGASSILVMGNESVTAGTSATGTASYAGLLFTTGAKPLQFGTNSVIQATLDSAGNLGLGVTPSAWNSSYKVTDVSAWGSVAGEFATQGTVSLVSNCFANSTGYDNWTYKNTAPATRYKQYNGTHQWFNAPSGTAGNAITFTQAMTLDASGNLLVGIQTASNTPTGGHSFNYGSGQSSYGIGHVTGTTSGTYYHVFNYNGSAIGSVTQNGTTGVLYNIVSDYRLKDVVGAVSGFGERIDALEPIEYTMKADGSSHRGFLAHKFQEVYANSVSGEKDAVDDDGNPKYQNMQAGTSEVIADLVAEIQSLRQRLAALEAK